MDKGQIKDLILKLSTIDTKHVSQDNVIKEAIDALWEYYDTKVLEEKDKLPKVVNIGPDDLNDRLKIEPYNPLYPNVIWSNEYSCKDCPNNPALKSYPQIGDSPCQTCSKNPYRAICTSNTSELTPNNGSVTSTETVTINPDNIDKKTTSSEMKG